MKFKDFSFCLNRKNNCSWNSIQLVAIQS